MRWVMFESTYGRIAMKLETACLSFLTLLLWSSAALAAPDAQTLLKHADRARGGGLPGIVWDIQLSSREGAKVAEELLLQVRANDSASVAEVLEPARSRGTKLLQVEHNMWLTRIGLSKPIPVSPRQRMSGQASNGDLAATNYSGDYEATLSAFDAVENEDCYVFELGAKHKRTTYDRIRYWVSVKREVGVKAEFYALSGKLLKTAYFDYGNFIEYQGQRIPFISKMMIRDALVDAQTTMAFSAVTLRRISAAEFDLGQMQ